MKINTLGPYYRHVTANVEALAAGTSLWQADAAALRPRLRHNYRRSESDALLSTLSDAQRLHSVVVAGVQDNAAFKEAVEKLPFLGWKDFTAPDVDIGLYESLAAKLYNAKPGIGDRVEIDLQDGSRAMGSMIINHCLRDKVPFVITFTEPDFQRTLFNHATAHGMEALAQDYLLMVRGATKSIAARSGMPDRTQVSLTNDNQKLFTRLQEPHKRKLSTGELFYTLTRIPTRKDAEIDDIPYDDYIKLFFEMCDQPWDLVGKAQSALIRKFNAASDVRITNDDGTDVCMSLIDHDGSHFTFCNGLIAKNVPGSEIFSAPRLDSVNGKVVAKGRFYRGGLIENLTLEFEKGKLVEYSAEKGQKHFKDAISVDEGARYVGELGIGTNPHLKRHVTNSLLVEKIGGSFHLALGRPYSYTEYNGEPVKLNNGGKSQLHWDITTMLHGRNGCIYLDGRKVMDNGQWVDPQYDVLNREWETVPRQDRPAYWKNYFDKPKAP